MHFYAAVPDELDSLSHRAAVERYAAGADVPAREIAGVPRDTLTSFPVPGTWSLLQIVAHLLDSDLVASYRMKRIVAETRPRLDTYDETQFANLLHYHDLDADDVCETFRRNRLVTAQMLRVLPESDFDRVADHPEIGELPLGRLVRIYVLHLDHHVEFIRRKRLMLCTPSPAAPDTP